MIRLATLAPAGALAAALMTSPMPSIAQQAGTVPAPAAAAERHGAWTAAKAAAAGSIIYLADADKKVGTLDLANGKVKVLGDSGVNLTDIAFAPGGKLYGVSFTAFYKVDARTGKATKVGRGLGLNGMNALACPTAATCLGYRFNGRQLYAIGTATGRARPIGTASGFTSAGDLVFFENQLLLASTDRQLVRLAPATGKVLAHVAHGVADLWGLVGLGDGLLFGLSGTLAFQFDPATGARRLLGDFAGQGLGTTQGAAFNGYFKG